ncbi:MAG: YbgC/FadM family acyl-CoA thioesterase [Chitinivibrionales bacterium]|nr:YbgC/FadM family acyl-CoA thioesterase [Chitinivibrionales bacterium]MBD3357168.1 YbgC/FadM family acyl-CoA thioesterase [Chitinivibrionales bacterium]
MRIRVYYEDTDCGNVVYYANYLKFMERSRTEYLRERGIDLLEYHEKGYLFAVVEVHVKYRRAARYNDLLEVESSLRELSSLSMLIDNTIKDQNGKLLATGEVKLVCIGPKGKACRIPREIADALAD